LFFNHVRCPWPMHHFTRPSASPGISAEEAHTSKASDSEFRLPLIKPSAYNRTWPWKQNTCSQCVVLYVFWTFWTTWVILIIRKTSNPWSQRLVGCSMSCHVLPRKIHQQARNTCGWVYPLLISQTLEWRLNITCLILSNDDYTTLLVDGIIMEDLISPLVLHLGKLDGPKFQGLIGAKPTWLVQSHNMS
jgi:hypothetical protein